MDCSSFLSQISLNSQQGDSFCNAQTVTVQNSLDQAIQFDLNSNVCAWDGGDCCTLTCSGTGCSSSNENCIDPDVATDDFCEDPPLPA